MDIEGESDPNELRLVGNHYFSSGKLNEAFQCYDLAVELLRSEPSEQANDLAIHLCNRSACSLKMGQLENALADATEAVSLSQGKYAKAYFRLARAQIDLEKYSDATNTIKKALQNYTDINSNSNELSGSTKKTENEKNIAKQEQADFQKLLVVIHKKRQQIHKKKDDLEQQIPLTTVKTEKCKAPSIRDFKKSKILGEGNFSKVIICTHTKTNEAFALKIINKDEAERLAKRQHPNVYNEIKMERKLLCEKLNSAETIHPNLVRCWHAFQDYENLYFLMDYYEGGDLWSRLFHGKKMVGCHFSLIPHYTHQILSGIEHLHSLGIAHRDLKPENILIDSKGHPIIIDLGTAKDLIDTDLNGPEFVGTPDFMTPEAVNGNESSFEADLWTFGAILFQMFTGQTPFHSVSPYMTFLRIKRARVRRKISIIDDQVWDLIEKLMQLDPKKRLGAGSFEVVDENGKKKIIRKTKNGYEAIRSHPYFQDLEEKSKAPNFEYETIPTLADLCIRSCADLVYADSQNLEIPDPGDNSSHDILRLTFNQKKRIMHCLDRMHFLHNPRVYRRFFRTRQEARLEKIRPNSADFVGLTIEDFPLAEQQQQMDDGVKVVIKFVFLANPLFFGKGLDKEEENLSHLKECVRKINKLRPKAVVVCGGGCQHHVKVRKLLSKVNESINVVINDGQHFFAIWLSRSVQAVVFNKANLDNKYAGQNQWLNEELEQYRVARNNTFAFCDCDPASLNESLKRKLAKSKIRCIYGIGERESKHFFEQDHYVLTAQRGDEVDEFPDDGGDSDEEEENDSDINMDLFCGNRSLHLMSVEEDSGEMKSEFIDIN